MRFASLGSGSSGNALLIESDGTLILLDCGFSLAEVTARLARAGVEPGEVDAIIVTHEHEDHGGGVAKLASSFGIAVYLTRGTLSGLGADGADVRGMVLGDGLRLVLTGLGVGVVAAIALSGLLSSQLFGVDPREPIIYVSVTVTLLLVGLAACFVPAWRATRVNPVTAMRAE